MMVIIRVEVKEQVGESHELKPPRTFEIGPYPSREIAEDVAKNRRCMSNVLSAEVVIEKLPDALKRLDLTAMPEGRRAFLAKVYEREAVNIL